MSIRVLIVDDHAVVRSGLRLLLDAEEGLEPVGEAGNARDAVFQARALKPDVILLDIVMPDQTGLDALPKSIATVSTIQKIQDAFPGSASCEASQFCFRIGSRVRDDGEPYWKSSGLSSIGVPCGVRSAAWSQALR